MCRYPRTSHRPRRRTRRPKHPLSRRRARPHSAPLHLWIENVKGAGEAIRQHRGEHTRQTSWRTGAAVPPSTLRLFDMRRNRLLRGKRARLGSRSNRGWHKDGGSAGFGRRGFLSGPPPCVFVAAQNWGASLGPGPPAGFFFPPKLMGDSFFYANFGKHGGRKLGCKFGLAKPRQP